MGVWGPLRAPILYRGAPEPPLMKEIFPYHFRPIMHSTTAASSPPVLQLSEIRSAFDLCAVKALGNLPALADSQRTWAFDLEGDYQNWNEGFFEIGNWTAGFFTGMGLLAWMDTKDDAFLDAVSGMDELFERKVNEGAADTMHDLGFLYLPYAVGRYELTGDEPAKELALKAAEVLAGRFIEKGGYIRAWGRMDETGPAYDYDGLAIIDCMMNLPLLYWASRVTGNPRFKEMAVRHSDTTLKNFVRDDGSVYHSFRFEEDGSPKGPDNYCGRAVESHWARGAAWAMYGFALGYKHTGDERYLEASLKVTKRWISLLDEEVVPVWDFCLEPGEPLLRDSSAAAIAVCAIQELGRHGQADAEMLAAKDALLARLCSEDYFDARPEIRGVLKQGEVGDGVGKARSAYTSWGDYYLMEGLAVELGHEPTWW